MEQSDKIDLPKLLLELASLSKRRAVGAGLVTANDALKQIAEMAITAEHAGIIEQLARIGYVEEFTPVP